MIVESYTALECMAHARFWARDARLSLGRAVQARSREPRTEALLEAVESLLYAEQWRARARRVRAA